MPTVDGAELLMHIGIDTVKLGGKHFTYLVNEGDKVRKGQPLIRFDIEAIKAEGYPVTTPLIVCNTDEYAAVTPKASGTVKQGDALLEDLANDAVAQQIENGNIQYDRMVYFEKDVNGKITALKTNIGEINHLKTDILNIINGKILELDAVDIGIPVGSLFLPEFFSGKGPNIPVHILAIRNSDATFSSAFHQAGINQTLHQLLMEVSVDAAVLVLG